MSLAVIATEAGYFANSRKRRTLPWIACSAAIALAGCGDGEQGPPGWTKSEAPTPANPEQETNPAAPVPNLEGRWGLLGDEVVWDFVAVDLKQQGTKLTGSGCVGAGLSDNGDPSSCGEITNGWVEPGRAHFEFRSPFAVDLTAAYVVVSADGYRMTGQLFYLRGLRRPTCWLPFASSEDWLPDSDEIRWPAEAHARLPLDLELLEDKTQSGEFLSDHTYHIQPARNGIVGDLGCFWDQEMTFNLSPNGDGTITAGPVVATESNLPVRLDLHLDAGKVTRVEAQTPSGGSYLFAVIDAPGNQ